MVLLRGDEFKNRITALQRDVLTDPLSGDWTIYERTKQVLQVHDSGLIFLTINRAQLRQNGDTLAIDWESIRLSSLSGDDLKEWTDAVRHIATTIRFANSLEISRCKLIST